MLLNTLLSHIAPHECLGCRQEGSLLCDLCSQQLKALPERCYRCHRVSPGGRTCQQCRRHTDLFAVRPYTSYEGLAKQLVWQLKFDGAQDAARDLARLLAVGPLPEQAVLVPVPTASSRVRQRGYDQARLIARGVAVETGVTYADCLKRLGQHHQVGAGRAQRVTQLKGAYRCARPKSVQGAHIVLIDDVLTTGATLEAAAAVIRAAGAKRVSALVFAQA